MRHIPVVFSAVLAALPVLADDADPPPNPAIDMRQHIRLTEEAANLREGRRLTEGDFLRMSGEPDTVVLDARSTEMYDRLHVRGAVHLSYPDFTAEALARVIPARTTRILIYCNNNFPDSPAFRTKIPPASLNLSTFATLYMYGYANVYELGPIVQYETTKLTLDGRP